VDFGKKRTVQLDKDDVPIQFLGERVRQALLAREDKSVFIRADGQVTVQEMAAVWDKLKEGGVEKVGMMTKPVER
jgi:biopolymer transport protein ExbD